MYLWPWHLYLGLFKLLSDCDATKYFWVRSLSEGIYLTELIGGLIHLNIVQREYEKKLKFEIA